jgi:hypothetical protein
VLAERRQAKRNSLADKLSAEAKVLADLKIEKAAMEGERHTVEADVGPVRYLASLIGADNETVLRLTGCESLVHRVRNSRLWQGFAEGRGPAWRGWAAWA